MRVFQEANNALADCRKVAISMLKDLSFGTALACYQRAKCDLNEPQYRQRLQAAILQAAENERHRPAVDVIKDQQSYARTSFLTQRQAVNDFYLRLRPMCVELCRLVDGLKVMLRQTNGLSGSDVSIAMNNVLAGNALSRLIAARTEAWEKELRDTCESADLAERNLSERLQQAISKEPYCSLRAVDNSRDAQPSTLEQRW